MLCLLEINICNLFLFIFYKTIMVSTSTKMGDSGFCENIIDFIFCRRLKVKG
jgi:hypothetical protein